MELKQFALRHKATGLFMPQTENNRGYSHWMPGGVSEYGTKNGISAAIPDSVRLFPTEKAAHNARVAWARGIMDYSYRDPMEGDGNVKAKDVGRKKDDLEVVPMVLASADRAVLHVKLSQTEALKVMKEAFERTLAEYREVLLDADRFDALEGVTGANPFEVLTVWADPKGPDDKPCWNIKFKGTHYTGVSLSNVTDILAKYVNSSTN